MAKKLIWISYDLYYKYWENDKTTDTTFVYWNIYLDVE